MKTEKLRKTEKDRFRTPYSVPITLDIGQIASEFSGQASEFSGRWSNSSIFACIPDFLRKISSLAGSSGGVAHSATGTECRLCKPVCNRTRRVVVQRKSVQPHMLPATKCLLHRAESRSNSSCARCHDIEASRTIEAFFIFAGIKRANCNLP